MEPSKKNTRSMKARDRNKPIIEQSIINKQIKFMEKDITQEKKSETQL